MKSICYICKKISKRKSDMKDSALSVANYFVKTAIDDKIELKPLKLMKLVYIAHGYMLALLDRSVLNPRFDKVEAWKLGPVVPSVYHSFKIYGNNPVKKMTGSFVDARLENGNMTVDYVEPMLEDKDAKKVCEYVWYRYGKLYSDSTLVSILHRQGTPWATVYEEGKNNIIPDEFTQAYYKAIVDIIIANRRKENGGR